ncbi:MAG: adenosine deaminase [Flavobacteriales bacterium]|nr:adenosine deaminase [Flavobacteriales bacterium]
MNRLFYIGLTLCFAGCASDQKSIDQINWIQALPKVEMHIHLDGSVRLNTIWEIAQTDSIDLGVQSIEELKEICTVVKPMSSLQEVLDVFWVHQKVMNSRENIARVAYENIEDAYRDGVVLLELRFAPTFIAVGKENLSYSDIIKGVLDGVERGMDTFDIEVGLIGIGVRGMDPAANKEALVDLIKLRKGNHPMADRLVGYDLAATEAGFKSDEFLDLINTAKDGGLRITIHSGEDTDAAHVRNTLEILGAERIGHGVKSWDDPKVIELLKERNAHLELSVTSNWLTKTVLSIEDHPIKKLYEAGVSISINTDDAHLMGIDLMYEYELIEKTFGFTKEDFMNINADALEHSFLSEEIKAKVRDRYFLN